MSLVYSYGQPGGSLITNALCICYEIPCSPHGPWAYTHSSAVNLIPHLHAFASKVRYES